MDQCAPGDLSAVASNYQAATGARPMFLLEGSTGLCVAGWKLPPHRVSNVWTPHHALGYRLSGTATISRKCGGIELRKVPAIGSVTFSPGDQPTEWGSDSPIEAIHIYIARDAFRRFAEQHLDGMSEPRIPQFFGVTDPWFDAYFRLLAIECAVRDDPLRRSAASLFLDQTQRLLLRHLLCRYSDASGGMPRSVYERGGVRPLPRGVTRRIEDYIEKNLDRSVSLPMLAGVARMSVDHFSRAFRAATGKTPHRFVLDVRLEHAAAMLKADRISVAQVARACGFRSAAHFSVKFRARFGVTPSEYRRSA